MKLFAAGVLAVALIPSQNLRAQDASSQAMPDSVATLRYIHAAWDTLTRSMSDCKTLADTKVNSEPVLYLPADMPAPPEVAEVGRQCNVRIATLPRKIDKLGDVRPEELPEPGLLYLPHPYVVPGGRFNEMYGWDSYFIVLGLEADHRAALAKGIVDNFLFEIEHYGAVLNANRTYYLTRSQPPFLTSMVRAVFENPESFAQTPDGRLEARQWLQHAYELAQKDYATWIRPEHKAGATGLTRYYDYGSGPVPEMADDSTYYSDVIRWLVENPHAGGEGFLVKGSEHPNAAEMSALKQTSCDVETSVVCMKAWADGYRLSKEFYKGDRAMRESGFDTGFRFGPFDGNAENYAPVDLNSLLFRYERDLEHLALLLGQARDAEHWDRQALKRNAAMQRYLWRPKDGVYADFDFVHAKSSNYAYITSLYPLWAGVATREQARSMVAKLDLFERPGGLSTSNTRSGMQWDEPYGWAPTNWLVVDGLQSMGYREEAARIASHFTATVDAGFAHDGTIREKYNVVTGSSDVVVSNGYRTNEIGFGWTNAVYLLMKEIKPEPDTAMGK
jgi:alpha,alpha-trehalase